MTAAPGSVGIVGAGAWGTAIADVLAEAGRPVMLWSQDGGIAGAMRSRRVNPRLPDVELHEGVRVTEDPWELAAASRVVVLTVTTSHVPERARMLRDVLGDQHILLHANGAFAQPGDRRVSELLRQLTQIERLGALAGPAMPEDLVARAPASLVVASDDPEVVAEARAALGVPPALRVYGSRDLVGVELAAAISGAHTVILGLADALGVTEGVRAVLITRALAEASRIGAAAGADPQTFAGLAGLGNLLVRASPTAVRPSAGYKFGLLLGQGARAGDNAPEGVAAAAAAARLADRHGVYAPLLRALDAIVKRKMTVAEAAEAIQQSVAHEE